MKLFTITALVAALVIGAAAVPAAGLAAAAPTATSDDPPRGSVECTPNVWIAGCGTPISLPALLQLLDSHAASLSPVRFLTSHYVVWADDCQTSLGSWAKVDGLDVAAQTVQLTRAAGGESQLVQAWLSDVISNSRRSDVTVTLVTSLGEPLASWRLADALPLSWSIHASDSGSKLLLETLELSHQGLTQVAPC